MRPEVTFAKPTRENGTESKKTQFSLGNHSESEGIGYKNITKIESKGTRQQWWGKTCRKIIRANRTSLSKKIKGARGSYVNLTPNEPPRVLGSCQRNVEIATKKREGTDVYPRTKAAGGIC